MTKKNRTKILLGSVILIYAAVIYRYLSLSDSTSGLESKSLISKKLDISSANDQQVIFDIDNNHKDPFLGSQKASRKSKGATNKEIIPSAVLVDVSYQGLISDADGKNKIFAVKIDGIDQIIKVGETNGNITVLSGDRERLVIKENGKIIEIILSE